MSVSFHIAYMEYVRTLYGRSDGSDVKTKPNFFALMGLNLLAMGLRSRAPQGARGSSAKTPREITSMDRKMSSKGCSEVKQVAVSTLQEKNVLQKQKVLSTKSHEYTRLFGE